MRAEQLPRAALAAAVAVFVVALVGSTSGVRAAAPAEPEPATGAAGAAPSEASPTESGRDAGFIRTREGWRDGAVSLAGGAAPQGAALRVGDVTVPWDEVIVAVRGNPRALAARAPHRVLLASGEVLRGSVVGLSRGVIQLADAPGGTRELDAAAVTAVELVPGACREAQRAPSGTLVRRDGSEVAGRVLSLTPARAVASSPFGVVRLARAELAGWVPPPTDGGAPTRVPSAAFDEVELASGSTLRGAITLAGDALVVESAAVGRVEVAADGWVAIARHGPGRWDATLLRRRRTSTSPIVRGRESAPSPRARASLAPLDLSAAEALSQGARRALEQRACTEVVIELPPNTSEGARRWVSRVVAAEGSAGAAVVSLEDGAGGTLAELRVEPGAPAVLLEAACPGDGPLTLRVRPSDELRFPCDVVWIGPRVIAAALPGSTAPAGGTEP